jgi:tetratricopeptide (TPR) repeat protein
VAGLLEEEVRPALVRLSRRDLVEPEAPRLAGEERWAFRHALVRDEAYATIPKRRRAVLHERVAELVDRRAGEAGLDVDELVGHHLAAAYDARAAVEPGDSGLAELARAAALRLAAAGRRAYDERDTTTTAGLLRRAADLLPSGSPERLALAPYLADALSWMGDRDAAMRELDDAERAAEPDDLVTKARIAIRRHDIHLWALEPEDPEEVYAAARRAIEVLSDAGDDEGLALAYVLAYHTSYRRPVSAEQGELPTAPDELRLAVAHARAAGARMVEGLATSWLCVVMRRGADPAEDVEAEVARVLADPPTQFARASALGTLGTLRAMQGSFDEGRRLLGESHALLEELGAPPTAAADLIAVADVEILAGEDASAERILREALDRLEGFGDRFGGVNAAWRLAQLLVRQDRLDDAEWALERAAELEVSEFAHIHVWRSVIGATIAARRGDAPAARALLAEADRSLAALFRGGMYADVLVQWARASALLGDLDDAVDRLRRAAAAAQRVGYVVTQRQAEVELATLGAHAGR